MGKWFTNNIGKDNFQDIDKKFFAFYHQGLNPVEVGHYFQKEFVDFFKVEKDQNHAFFGLAMAQ